MKIQMVEFGGISPYTPPRFLANTQAQTAYNCLTGRGPITPLQNTDPLMQLPKPITAQSIYRFGQDGSDETQYWFHWDQDVDVVRGFINGDKTERTFFSGDGEPKATDVDLMKSASGLHPGASVMLGVPIPQEPLECTVEGTVEESPTTETRVYTYTVVNSWGEESAPYTGSLLTQSVTVQSGEFVRIELPTVPAGNYVAQSIRLYRSVAGTYLLVYASDADGNTVGTEGDIPAGTSFVWDRADADELGTPLPSLTWLPPEKDLRGLVGLPGGVLAGFSGIDLYFSEPYRPFAWPIQYNQTLGYNIVGLGAIDTTVVVLTVGKPYFVQGASPDAMVVVEGDLSQACSSKRSIVSMNNSVIYASPDGIVSLAPGGSGVVTEGLFTKAQWRSLFNPESIHAYAYEDKYIGFYNNGDSSGGFVYDLKAKTFTLNGITAQGGYTDLRTDTLYLTINNHIHKWHAGAPLEYTWRSKMFTLPDLTAFTCYRVTAESYPITVRFYRNGEIHHTNVVTNREIYRLPSGYAHDFEVEVTGTGEIFSIAMAQTPREIASG